MEAHVLLLAAAAQMGSLLVASSSLIGRPTCRLAGPVSQLQREASTPPVAMGQSRQ